MGGRFPATAEELRALPGIGGYTAGAIAAIAYDEKQAAMDANAERVIARLYAVETPMPKAKAGTACPWPGAGAGKAGRGFRAGADGSGFGDLHAQTAGLRQLSAGSGCARRGKRGIQEELPVKAPKMARPLKRGAAFVARDAIGAVLLVKRPDKGLLGLHAAAAAGPLDRKISVMRKDALSQAPFPATWKKRPGLVRHGFTHFELEIEVYVADCRKTPASKGGRWSGVADLCDSRAAHRDAQDSSNMAWQ